MTWKISIYEEPGILLAVKSIAEDSAIERSALDLLKAGIEQKRNLLALAEKEGNPELVAVYPALPAEDLEFEALKAKVQENLSEARVFETVQLVDSAIRGGHGDDREVQMLAASVYELVKFFPPAIPLLTRALPSFDGLRLAATQMRLARAKLRSAQREGVASLLKSSLDCQELPQEMRIEALLLRATVEPKEEAIETLDELLDLAEEHLGDHQVAAEALELHADLISVSDEEKAEQFYLAAGKMLLRLKDPYFFNLNERLVIHQLRHRKFQPALSLCQEMFQLLRDTGGPARAGMPFLVFASWVHQQTGDLQKAKEVREAARALDPEEVERIEANMKLALAETVEA